MAEGTSRSLSRVMILITCRCLRSNPSIAPQEPGTAPEMDLGNHLMQSLLNAQLHSHSFLCSHHWLSHHLIHICLCGRKFHWPHCALDCSRSLWPLKFASFFLAHEYKLEILWRDLLTWMDLQETQAGSFCLICRDFIFFTFIIYRLLIFSHRKNPI